MESPKKLSGAELVIEEKGCYILTKKLHNFLFKHYL